MKGLLDHPIGSAAMKLIQPHVAKTGIFLAGGNSNLPPGSSLSTSDVTYALLVIGCRNIVIFWAKRHVMRV